MKCPFCDSEINDGALKCQYCKNVISKEAIKTVPVNNDNQLNNKIDKIINNRKTLFLAIFLSVACGPFGLLYMSRKWGTILGGIWAGSFLLSIIGGVGSSEEIAGLGIMGMFVTYAIAIVLSIIFFNKTKGE